MMISLYRLIVLLLFSRTVYCEVRVFFFSFFFQISFLREFELKQVPTILRKKFGSFSCATSLLKDFGRSL